MRQTSVGDIGLLPTQPSVHLRQQSEQERTSLPALLQATELVGDPSERSVELFLRPMGVYAGRAATAPY
jgi:hypothetical protein